MCFLEKYLQREIKIEEYKTDDKVDRYIMLYYKTNKFTGKLHDSKEGKVFWINKKDLKNYRLSLDLKRILKIMESDKLSELIYKKKKGGEKNVRSDFINAFRYNQRRCSCK